MKSLAKKKIKTFFKKKLGWIIGSGVFLIAGIVLLFVGFSITGWDFVKWINSPYATTTLILLILGIACIVILTLVFIQIKMIGGGKDE